MPLVNTMGDLDNLELLHAAHRHQCALMAHGNLKEDSFKNVQQQAKDLFQDMMKILRPWEKFEKQSGIDDLVEEFKRHFGDPNDPAIRAKYDNEARIVSEQLAQKAEQERENKKKLEEFEQKLKQNNGRLRRGIRK